MQVHKDIVARAPENLLNSIAYNEEQQLQRHPEGPTPNTNYSREVIKHLLSFLPP